MSTQTVRWTGRGIDSAKARDRQAVGAALSLVLAASVSALIMQLTGSALYNASVPHRFSLCWSLSHIRALRVPLNRLSMLAQPWDPTFCCATASTSLLDGPPIRTCILAAIFAISYVCALDPPPYCISFSQAHFRKVISDASCLRSSHGLRHPLPTWTGGLFRLC